MRWLPSLALALSTSFLAFGQGFRTGPEAVTVDKSGNVYFTDQFRVLRLDGETGNLTVVAGSGIGGVRNKYNPANGPATRANLLGTLRGLAVDSTGNLYISESITGRVLKVSNGVITTLAGNGTRGFSGDNGPATSAQLASPCGLAVDSDDNLYIADRENHRVRKVSNGLITTVAGTGTKGYSGDNGPATSAQLHLPCALAIDSAGNIYIGDSGNERVRKVSKGVITTLAGTGSSGYSGDSGPATHAQLDLAAYSGVPEAGLAVDVRGNVYIADQWNFRIRKVSNGVITTVAGGGSHGYSGDDGPATQAQLSMHCDVAADGAGNLFIADRYNFRIRKVSNGVITTVVGNGVGPIAPWLTDTQGQ